MRGSSPLFYTRRFRRTHPSGAARQPFTHSLHNDLEVEKEKQLDITTRLL